jgi:electron transfer flavoprotein alpha subunit
MKDIFIIAEHRQERLQDITWEAIAGGREVAGKTGGSLNAILLGFNVDEMARELSERCDRVFVIKDKRLENYNSELYQEAIFHIIPRDKPFIVMIGHTSTGMDLAPGLSLKLDVPLATDCLGIEVKEGRIFAIRQVYSSKVNARVFFADAKGCMITIRPGSYKPPEGEKVAGEVVIFDSPLKEIATNKVFVEYVAQEAAEVDISQADIIVAIGRGIGDAENIAVAQSLAEAIGGVIACSRPVVDKKWLPKYRQVGTSGVTVKPKIYIALGISGTFQHMGGIKGSPVIIAINKDKNAPIFRIANYGIVDDLLKVVPIIDKKIREIKGLK